MSRSEPSFGSPPWIAAILPHRYPFLLVDRVLEIEPKQRILAYKNVTHNEPFFPGHFPGHPIMPGVLVIEALAQAAGILMLHDLENRDDKIIYFSGIEKAKFRRPVLPGDQLMLEVVVQRLRSIHGRFRGTATVGKELAVEAICSSTMVDR